MPGLRHPQIDQLQRAFGGAYQPERKLAREFPTSRREGIGAFGQGHAGLVEKVLHRRARMSQVADQRVKSAIANKAAPPPVQPEPHVNLSNRRGQGGYRGSTA